jgi:hypothetical protein
MVPGTTDTDYYANRVTGSVPEQVTESDTAAVAP